MDVKLIIKDMVRNGMTKDEIVANISELGIQDPERIYEESLQAMHEVKVQQPVREVSLAESRPAAEEPPAGKPLFGAPVQAKQATPSSAPTTPSTDKTDGRAVLDEETNALFDHKPQSDEQAAREAVEDIPKLEITSVAGSDEKTVDIETMLGKQKEDRQELMKGMPSSSLANIDDVERKLDEAIALLKALQEINKKILEANRDIASRLA